MFIELIDHTKEQIINIINNGRDDERVVFHFKCENCDDKQTTYIFSLSDVKDLIESNKDLGDEIIFPLQIPCISCDCRLVFLSTINILGMEVL